MEQKTLANAFEAHLGGVQLSSPDDYRISKALLTYIHVFVSPQVFPQLGDIEKQLKRVPERWEGEPGSKKRRIDEVYPVMGASLLFLSSSQLLESSGLTPPSATGSLMFQPARDGVVEAGKPLDEHDPRAIREVFRSYRIVSQKEPGVGWRANLYVPGRAPFVAFGKKKESAKDAAWEGLMEGLSSDSARALSRERLAVLRVARTPAVQTS